MASFDLAAPKILKVEGGYQNMSADRGNYNVYDRNGKRVTRGLQAGTNWGISAMWLSGNLKREVSVAEMRSLTKSQALNYYKRFFWNHVRADQINDQLLADLVFDTVVNHGTGGGTKHIQIALNTLGKNLSVDGGFGNLTFAALTSSNPVDAFNAIRNRRLWWYNNLGQVEFRKGWNNRMKMFPVRSNGTQPTPTPRPLPTGQPTPPPYIPPTTNPNDGTYSGGNLPTSVVTASAPKSSGNGGTLLIGGLILYYLLS